jgi:hypothetical protein
MRTNWTNFNQMNKMKPFFIALLFCPLLSNSQIKNDSNSDIIGVGNEKVENFEFNSSDRTVKWVSIFDIDTSVSAKDLFDYFIKDNIIKPSMVEDSELSGTYIHRTINHKKYGYTLFGIPYISIATAEQRANVKIQYKNGRYRVVVSNLEYLNKGDSDIAVKGLFGSNAPTSKGNVETYDGVLTFNSEGKVRERVKELYIYLDKFYLDIFQYKKNNKKEEW